VSGVAAWSIELPPGWFEVPLNELAEADEQAWVRSVVDTVREAAAEPGDGAALPAQLRDVRADLIRRGDPWTRAALSVRPEQAMTIGCVLIGSQASLESDDDADAFTALLEEGFRHPDRGIRTVRWETWRERIGDATVVGSFQRYSARDLGDLDGAVLDRTLFGVFPDGSDEMIRLEFTVSDLATFDDIAGDTAAIVGTIDIRREELS
jgi:hypothetical protein